jgi:uncharacterized protein YndB with AHSA1/START domain
MTAPTDYQKTVRVHASPDALFDALTTPTGLTAWWTTAAGSGETGGELELTMGAPEPLRIHVDEATRASVQWTVTECAFEPDWVGTHPVFTITRVDDECELTFHHRGLTSELDCIDVCTSGWNHFIGSLREYAETGTGHPRGSDADTARRLADADPA